MGILFGTDGIRGIVNETLDSRLAYRVGQAAGLVMGGDEKPLFVIGKDTRISSDMLEAAVCAGLCSVGANVLRLDVIPTPGIAYLTILHQAAAGIVISASHNPFEYNGIKLFAGDGYKISDDQEAEMEALILSDRDLPVKTGADIGKILFGSHESEYYIKYIAGTIRGNLEDLRVLIDCANGATAATAKRLFSRFSIDVNFINDKPNGVNINDLCGSTHMSDLALRVKAGSYDVGIAFDGDGDRMLAVDEKGNEISGDVIMAVCARAMLDEGDLNGGAFVATGFSNLGLHKYARENGMQVVISDVGDKNVLEQMQRGGYVFGGESSGHIIFMNHMSTGDGQLTALHFLSILRKGGMPASKLAAQVPLFPQSLINVHAPHDKKERGRILESPELKTAVAKNEEEMGENGRIIIRASGTEALIRILVEYNNAEKAQKIAEDLALLIKKLQI